MNGKWQMEKKLRDPQYFFGSLHGGNEADFPVLFLSLFCCGI